MDLRDKKIVVTGGAGFLGQHLVARLRRAGCTRLFVPRSAQITSDSEGPAISGDGRYVSFRSYASSLVTGDTNAEGDVFVHDRQTGETRRVSVSITGAQADGERSGAPVRQPAESPASRAPARSGWSGSIPESRTPTTTSRLPSAALRARPVAPRWTASSLQAETGRALPLTSSGGSGCASTASRTSR